MSKLIIEIECDLRYINYEEIEELRKTLVQVAENVTGWFPGEVSIRSEID